MPRKSVHKYALEIRSLAGSVAVVTAGWTEEECRTALAKLIQLACRLPNSSTSLFWVQVIDESGALRLVTTWDWMPEDVPAGLRQIRRLARNQRRAFSQGAVERKTVAAAGK